MTKVAWNKEKTASVVLSKVKEFTITGNTYNDQYSVRGWYNKENYFHFGDFVSLPAAQEFLHSIHNKM